MEAEVKLDHVGSLHNAAVVISRLHRGEKRLVFVDSRSRAEQLGRELRSLEVIYCGSINAAATAHLGGLTKLKELRIEQVDDEALQGIKGLKNLERMELFYTQVGDEGRGVFFPFLIQDLTPRKYRVYPRGKPSAPDFTGVTKVVIVVKDLDSAVERPHGPAVRAVMFAGGRLREHLPVVNAALHPDVPTVIAESLSRLLDLAAGCHGAFRGRVGSLNVSQQSMSLDFKGFL